MQGDLDGLCGVYSIVNAVQWALHTCTATAWAFGQAPKRLIWAEREALFDALVTALGRRRPLAKFVIGGVSSLELTKLLRLSREWVSKHRRAVLVSQRPFYRQRAVAGRRVINLLAEHLAAPGSAAIVAIDAPLAHWTVVTGLSKKRMRLHDSGYRVFAAVNGIDFCSADQPNGVKPGDIFLLRLSPKPSARAQRP
jgi:hypothetical protein